MKVSLLILSVTVFLAPQLASASDFREVTWGMSQSEVKKTETTAPVAQRKEYLAYKGKVAGFSSIIYYTFIDDKLVYATYLLNEQHLNSNDYIHDYKTLKTKLTKKYAQPTKDGLQWKDDMYKSDPTHWGMAVAMGQLSYFAIWGTETTSVSLILTGDNFKSTVVIRYDSKKYAGLVEKKEEAGKEEGL